MAAMDPIPYYNQQTTGYTMNSTYVQPVPTTYHGYQCPNCYQYVYGQHNCYYSLPVQTIIYQPAPPTPGLDFNRQLQEVKEELNEVRNLLEKLMNLAVNGHEEVCGSDERGSGDPSADAEGDLEGTTLRDVAEIVKRLNL